MTATYDYRTSDPTTGAGIYLYTRMNGAWFKGYVNEDNEPYDLYEGPFNSLSPIRLVVNTEGQFVLFRGIDEDDNYALCETYPELEGVSRVVELSDGVNMTHDCKPYQGDTGQRRTATAHVSNITNPIVKYEEMTEAFDWSTSGENVTVEHGALHYGRSVALDFFDSSEFGVLWIDNEHDLVFRKNQNGWLDEEVLDYDVGDWCDFDYDKSTRIPCVAYEKLFTVEEETYNGIFVRVYVNSSWSDAIPVDTLDEYDESHLDLDVSNGYIYVAYSKNNEIYCAILDFCSM